jgi:hypothetical protein
MFSTLATIAKVRALDCRVFKVRAHSHQSLPNPFKPLSQTQRPLTPRFLGPEAGMHKQVLHCLRLGLYDHADLA